MLLIALALGFILGRYLMLYGENEKWTPDKINLYYNQKQSQMTKLERPQAYGLIQSLIVFEKGDMMSGAKNGMVLLIFKQRI